MYLNTMYLNTAQLCPQVSDFIDHLHTYNLPRNIPYTTPARCSQRCMLDQNFDFKIIMENRQNFL